jgi:hypothetical protein
LTRRSAGFQLAYWRSLQEQPPMAATKEENKRSADAVVGFGTSDLPTDISLLWQEALVKYQKQTGINLGPSGKNVNVAMIIADQDAQLKTFNTFRHDGGKVDKLRSLASRNVDIIQGIAKHIGDAASSSFPPSTVIITAFTFVLNASKMVTEDYDMIMSFYDLMNSFLERISLLESKLPPETVYRVLLTKVFVALLNMCAIARQYRQKGRFAKWAKALMDGNDPNLADAFSSLNTTIQRLESATTIATLKWTMETGKKVDDVLSGQSELKKTGEDQLVIATEALKMTQQTQKVVENGLIQNQKTMVAVERQSIVSAESLTLLKDLQHTMKSRDNPADQGLDGGTRKSMAMSKLSSMLLGQDEEFSREAYTECRDRYIPNTFDWVREEKAFQDLA